jgi:alkylation response protein AidB-like acyl-CoA dehydrogenase
MHGTGAMTTTITAEDVNELRSVLRDFLETLGDIRRVREVMETDTGLDDLLWRRMADELGLPGLGVPEEFGGAGYSGAVQLAVFEELGRSLACVPYLSTVGLAIPALLASGNRAVQHELLPPFAAGTMTATVAFVEPDGDWSVPDCRTVVRPLNGDSVTLSGRKSFVLDGCTADVILVFACGPGGLAVYAVDATATGVSRTPMRTLDPTRRMATLDFHDTPARAVADTYSGRAVLERTLDFANACVAAEQLGGAQRCLEMSVDYAGMRQQFGRPIGSFQAVKHRCADMLLAVESARSAVHHLSEVIAGEPNQMPIAATLAKAYCSDAYMYVAAENLHIHGGMGFTWEHDAHLYFRRAQSSAALHGDSTSQRRELADRLGF